MTDSTNDEDAYLEQLAREDDFIIKCMTTYERLREVFRALELRSVVDGPLDIQQATVFQDALDLGHQTAIQCNSLFHSHPKDLALLKVQIQVLCEMLGIFLLAGALYSLHHNTKPITQNGILPLVPDMPIEVYNQIGQCMEHTIQNERERVRLLELNVEEYDVIQYLCESIIFGN